MKTITNNILFWSLYSIVYITSLLPMWLLYKLSNVSYMLMLHIVPYRKTVVIQNLSRSFPEKNYKEINSIMKEFYQSFTDNFAEILKTISIPIAKQEAKITLVDFHLITENIKQGNNVIASMGHCGNWEILNTLPNLLNVNCYAAYKPLKAQPIDQLFLKLRSRFGMNLVPSKSFVRHFIANKSTPSAYFLLADQCPKVIEEKFRFDFLNQRTGTFSGIEKLSRSSGAIVVYIHVIKRAQGEYYIVCKSVSENSKDTQEGEITQNYVNLLEQNIQEQPSGWLWTHKRWKR